MGQINLKHLKALTFSKSSICNYWKVLPQNIKFGQINLKHLKALTFSLTSSNKFYLQLLKSATTKYKIWY